MKLFLALACTVALIGTTLAQDKSKALPATPSPNAQHVQDKKALNKKKHSVKEDAKEAAKATKRAAVKTAHATKHAAKEASEATEHAAAKTAKVTKHAAKAAAKEATEDAKELKHETKDARHKMTSAKQPK